MRTFIPFLILLFTACSNGLSGTYKEVDGDTILELKSDGTCIADHGGGTIIGGKYRLEGDKVLFQWDNGQGDGAIIKGDTLLNGGMELVKQ